MRTKKAIANQFKANEAFIGSLNALTSTIKKGRYRVLNSSGQYETIHLETSANQVIENSDKKFVSDTEKAKWDNKAERFGNASQDFSAKTLNVSNAILPTRDGIDIGSADKRFRGIYVDEAYLSTNTLYIGDTPILGTNDDTITIKADPDQSITMQTKATGTTKIISEAGVELSTAGMNANVVVQAKGSNAQVNIASTSSTNIDAAIVNIKGNTTFQNNIQVDGNLTVTGANTTLSTSNLVIKDNIIELNHGQTGNGVSEGKAGIKINRGDSDAFNIVFDETDDSLKVGSESLLKTVALQEWVTSNTARPNHAHNNYLSLSGGNITGNLTINKNAVYHEGNKPSLKDLGAAADSHTHNSGHITALTGYSKPNSTSTISTSDTLNAALGKLEKGLEGKKDASWIPQWSEIDGKPATFNPSTHAHESNQIQKMTGYIKGAAGTAIVATDTLNSAISKLEVSLDGKAASSHKHTTSDITGLGSAAKLNAGTSANQVLQLDGNGKVPISTLPSIAINETFTAANKTEALTLTVEVGDIVIVTADAKTYICVNTKVSAFDDKFKALSSGTDSITKLEVENLLKNKVDKESGKGLSTNDFTTAEKNKLNGIAIGANNYVHPDDANTRHVTDADKNNWNSKAAGNHTHNSLLATDLANQTVSLNTFNLSSGSPQVAYYYCRTDGYGSNITGRPDDSAKYAFSLKVELVRWNDSSDYITKQTYTLGIHKITYVRYCNSGTWSTWEKMYTSSIKPTLTELGAAATSHNHTSLTGVTKIGGAGASCSWGSIDISGSKASWAGINFSDMGHSFLVNKDGYAGVWKNGGNAVFAFNESGALVNGTVGWDKITGKPSTLPPSAPHANSISGSNNTGVSTANDANKIWKSGFYETSNGTNYPSSGSWYWLIHAGHTSNNSGGSYQYGMQITAQNGTSNFYIRTTNNVGVGTWNKLYHTGNKPTLTELGITTLTRGSYLTGSNYNGTAATTWAVDATTAATANKVVARDANADVNARLFRSNYANGNTISGAIAFRVNNSNDDYIRFCSDTGAIRTFLNTYAKSETYTRSEMDSRYMQKTNVVFEGTISIKTPAA